MTFTRSLLCTGFGNKGSSSTGAAKALVMLMAVALFLPNLTSNVLQSPNREQYMKSAKIIADKLKTLPLLDVTYIANRVSAIDKINFLIREINEVFKLDYPELNKNDKVMLNNIQELIPLVEPYNQLIKSARNFDETDTKTAEQLIVDAYALAFGVIVIEGKVSYSIAFEATGILNNVLKLGALKGIVGNSIYSAFLSEIHWFLSEKITNLPTELSDAINAALRQIEYT